MMPISYWSGLFVDRVKMLVVIGSKELYSDTIKTLYMLQANKTKIVPEGTIIVNKNKFCSRLSYYAKYGSAKVVRRKIADITVGARPLFGQKAPYRYFALTLYPSKFRGNDFPALKDVLAQHLPSFNYSKLFQSGKVNYLELAADCFSHENHTFFCLRKNCSRSSIYARKDGTLGALYVGHRKSSLQFRVYDKRRHLLDQGKAPTAATHTRFEAVLKDTKQTPAELGGLKNPFTRLHVLNKSLAYAASPEPEWKAFLDGAAVKGLQEMLGNHPLRTEYTTRLLRVPVPWWTPDSIWSGLTHALHAIDP